MTYCSTLTDRQVTYVYIMESQRMAGLSKKSQVYQAAKERQQEAKEELLRRGLEIPR